MARTPKSRALRFTRLRLRNWRNFGAVNIALAERAFFVGPNASGKSNLLDVFRFLAELATPGNGGLQAAIERRSGFTGLRNLNARNPSDVMIDVEIGGSSAPAIWRYLLRLNIRKNERRPTVVEERVWRDGKVEMERSRTDGGAEFLFSQTYLEQAEISRTFRPLCDFLASCRYLHVVPQIIRDPERGRRGGDDPYGGDLLRRMKDMRQDRRRARLGRISEALKLAVPQFANLELLDDESGVPHLYASYAHWRPNASKQKETEFSDGTLRLVGLLWSIAEGGGPLLLEEPELSLNDAVVSELPKLFKRMQNLSGRQVLATTHSTAFLDDPGILLSEVHRIVPGGKGSDVLTASDDPLVVAQVEQHEWTVGQAIVPLLLPRDVSKLGAIDVAA